MKNTTQDTQLIKRLKSLAWRTVMMSLAFIVAQLAANLDWFQLSAANATILGLMLGEISKYLNSKTS